MMSTSCLKGDTSEPLQKFWVPHFFLKSETLKGKKFKYIILYNKQVAKVCIHHLLSTKNIMWNKWTLQRLNKTCIDHTVSKTCTSVFSVTAITFHADLAVVHACFTILKWHDKFWLASAFGTWNTNYRSYLMFLQYYKNATILYTTCLMTTLVERAEHELIDASRLHK